MITVRFLCGHQTRVPETLASPPRCACGETRVTQVQARAPRFVGACTGPYAEYRSLAPGSVDLTTAGPLRLKEPNHGE